MEGVAVATNIDKIITALGIPATLIILGVIAFFVIREVRKENELTRKTLDSLKSSTENKMNELQKHSDEKDQEILDRLEKAEKEIKYIEHDYITKAEHYKDTEGWRSEIQGIRAEVTKLPLEILKLMKSEK